MEKQVKFLVDTNIWLERLLDQEKSVKVKNFLDIASTQTIFVTDFTLHSIGIIMTKLKKIKDFKRFISDLFLNGNVVQLGLNPYEFSEVITNTKKLNLDFDDSYQYTVAKKYSLKIVSLDADFKKAGIEALLPSEAIKTLKKNE
jgi:predicted nucleic acid-binding protein